MAINGNLEGLVGERTRALVERERSMRLVLDNTGDGLIPTSLDGAIKGEVSLAAREWLGAPTPNHHVWDYLYPSDDAGAAQFRLTFSQIADDTAAERDDEGFPFEPMSRELIVTSLDGP